MIADFNHDVTDVELIANQDGSGFLIRAQLVDQLQDGPKRSGKYIHLTITPTQAMRLLALLHGAQKALGLPVPAQVNVENVPPARGRN